MSFQHDNYGFSVPVVFRSKAQRAGNGRSLIKCCNAAAEHHRDALRVSLSRSTASPKAPTFGAPLAKGAAIACMARFASLGKLTELAIITLTEHAGKCRVLMVIQVITRCVFFSGYFHAQVFDKAI